MATIYTRAGKGSALTWAEGDANINNLNTAKIENIVEDTTPQLGGNLDVNGNSIISSSNGNINLQPNGTGKVVANKELEATLLRSTQSSGDEGGQINLALAATNTTLSGEVAIDINQNRLRIFETSGSNRGVYIDLSAASNGVGTNLVSGGGITDLVQDTTPQLGGSLDVNGQAIVSASNGNIRLEPNGTGNISLTPTTGKIILGALDFPTTTGTNGQVLTTNGTSAMSWTTISSGGITDLVQDTTPQLGGNLDTNGKTITDALGPIKISPSNLLDGIYLENRYIYLSKTGQTGNVFVSTVDAASLFLRVNDNAGGQGAIVIRSGADGNIEVTPSGTGQTVIKNLEYNENVYALGTTSGTIAPNVANGNVQTITLNGNLTLNAFTSPVTGQSLTLIINTNGTSRTLSSTMKFSGGSKTLSTTNTTDIITVFYDGTNYWASLAKDFK